jgi:hypothetical protein
MSKSKKDVKTSLPDKAMLPQLDLDAELERHNVAVAQLLILANLIKGDQDQRKAIIVSIDAICFDPQLFPQFLFRKIVGYLHEDINRKIPVKWIVSQIEDFYKQTYNVAPPKQGFQGELFRCAQILDFSPSPTQVLRAIELRKAWAKRKGLI